MPDFTVWTWVAIAGGCFYISLVLIMDKTCGCWSSFASEASALCFMVDRREGSPERPRVKAVSLRRSPRFASGFSRLQFLPPCLKKILPEIWSDHSFQVSVCYRGSAFRARSPQFPQKWENKMRGRERGTGNESPLAGEVGLACLSEVAWVLGAADAPPPKRWEKVIPQCLAAPQGRYYSWGSGNFTAMSGELPEFCSTSFILH